MIHVNNYDNSVIFLDGADVGSVRMSPCGRFVEVVLKSTGEKLSCLPGYGSATYKELDRIVKAVEGETTGKMVQEIRKALHEAMAGVRSPQEPETFRS